MKKLIATLLVSLFACLASPAGEQQLTQPVPPPIDYNAWDQAFRAEYQIPLDAQTVQYGYWDGNWGSGITAPQICGEECLVWVVAIVIVVGTYTFTIYVVYRWCHSMDNYNPTNPPPGCVSIPVDPRHPIMMN